MRTRPRATSRDLRLAIACLPRHTREAMLAGISGNDIIVGAYATGDGICPMLAAHRNGGRTNFIGFANAWDRFASRDGKRGRTRRATERELRVLRAHLEASLLEDDAPLSDLAAARAEHDGLVRERERSEAIARERANQRADARHRCSSISRLSPRGPTVASRWRPALSRAADAGPPRASSVVRPTRRRPAPSRTRPGRVAGA